MKLFDSVVTSKMTQLDTVIYGHIQRKTKVNPNNEIIKQYAYEDVINRKNQIKSYIKQLSKLRKLPLIKQRTPEWFNIRKNCLTASDLEDAIGKNHIMLAKKKAGVIRDTTNYTNIRPLKWGVMFEDMASRCYSQSRNNIEIFEFGLITDESQQHFGASPDGINEMGIMIEIKCPYSRKIVDNYVPRKYYTQIQGQLATCCLQECDYIECDFEAYDNIITYKEYIHENFPENCLVNHGVIAEYKHILTGEYFYLYSDANNNVDDAIANIEQKVKTFISNDYTFVRFTPWHLKQMNVQRVMFDKDMWVEILPKIDLFWENVENCKNLPIEEVKQKSKFQFIAED